MSAEAISRVIQELQGLEDSEQELVLRFLRGLRQKRAVIPATERHGEENTALVSEGGLLVFTGALATPGEDWVEIVRKERDAELMQSGVGNGTSQ